MPDAQLIEAGKRESTSINSEQTFMMNTYPLSNQAPAPESLTIEGVSYHPGEKIRLRLGKRRTDVPELCLDDRIATIEKIHTDHDGKVYLAVTMDDDPAQPILREMKIYRFFLPEDVELPERPAQVPVTQTSSH